MGGLADVLRRLDAVDWDFPRGQTLRGSVHAMHWFPGNFIPQIPAHLIQLLSQPGDLIVDPFCGSGTTGAEAYRLGRRSRQSDVCQASIQVARGKLALLATPDLEDRCGYIVEGLYFDSLARKEWNGCRELEAWFQRDTLEQLSFIWSLVENAEDEALREILELLFSDVLFACASTGGGATRSGGRRRHHWGWIADNVRPKFLQWHNAIQGFRERVMRAADVARSEAERNGREALVVREACGCLGCGEGEADLIVTSPPYLGMIDYALANRLTYLWMGWDLERDRREELGSRRGRDRKDAKAVYLDGVSLAAKNIYRAMRPGGYCAMVLGASRKYSDVGLEALEVFDRWMVRIWGPVGRTVSRRRVAERKGRVAREWICVYRKEA